MARVRESVKRVFRKITGCWHKRPKTPPAAPSATDEQHVQQDSSSATSPISPTALSASITLDDPSATDGPHVQQDNSFATSPISPTALSVSIRSEIPSAAGSDHIQREQSRDSLPATFPAAKSLWDRAYNVLAEENPDLVEKYNKLLAEEEPMANSSPSETTPLQLPEPHDHDTHSDLSPRQVQLKTVIQKGLRRMEDNKPKFKIAGREIDLEDKIAKAANILVWGKDFIGSAVKNSPEASLVWAGVSLIIPLFTNPTTAAEANKDGFSYVTSRMGYYVALEPMVRRLGQNASLDEALVNAANFHIVELYQAILDFQISSVLRFYQSRFKVYIHDTVTLRDWEETLLGIKTREETVKNALSQINDLAARERLELLNETSERTRETMESNLIVATQQLAVAKKQLTVAEKQLAAQEDEKHERLLAEQRKEQRECLQLFCLTRDDNGAMYDWYKDRVESRVEGTCNWFLKHDNFQKWLSQESGPLLVSADPGCGKSVLAKYLIDHELAKQSATICYFFFKDQDQNTIRQALCALLHQLLSQKSALIQHAMELYNKMGAKLIQSEQSLWTVLRNAVRDPQAGPVIFVIDALDECDQSQLSSLIKYLENMFRDQELADAKFKVLMTSRPYQQVVNEFHGLRTVFQRVHIPGEEEFETISQEINDVIHHRVKQLANKHQLSDVTKSALNSKLLAIGHRTYLWVYIVFEYLDTGFNEGFKKTEAGIDAAIQELPESVNQAYDQILNRSRNDKTFKIVKRVLSIILAARRPLTLSQMNIAMNLDGQDQGRSIYDLDLDQDVDIKSRLRALCGLFVSVHHDKIYFLHQTAREFLIQPSAPTTVSSNLQWHHSITIRHAHSVLAEVCMFYLDRLNSTHTETFRQGDRHDALLEYSVEHWDGHFREADFEKDSAMVDLASRLCTPDLTNHSKWASIMSSLYPMSPESNTNLLVASQLGLIPVIELLLSRGIDIGAKDYGGWTALMLAVTHGHEAVVRLLLEKGADVEAKDNDGWTALIHAAAFGQEAVSQLLLDTGADVEAKDNGGKTALIHAAAFGQEAVSQLLLDTGADVEAKDNGGKTALIHASTSNNEAVTQLLIDNGANVETEKNNGGTALMRAAILGHDALTRLLPVKGADAEAKNNDSKTALMHAATSGHEAATRLLLDKGDDIEARDDDGQTPLIHAAAFGHEAVTRLLLENGADIEAKKNDGMIALMHAAANGHEAVTRLLLEKGADVEVKDDDGWTALMLAAGYGHESVTRLLLENGADIEAKKNDGMTALMHAAANGHEAVTRLLLEKGADVEVKDDGGWTALMAAARYGHEAVTRLLLEKGDDVEARDDYGQTALMAAAAYGHEAVVRLLLDKGADIEAKSDSDQTALVSAARYGDEAVVRLLLDKGADVEVKDDGGWTALMAAARYGHEAVTRLLLENGADIEAKENYGKTALMHAATNGHEAVIRLLIDKDADVEARDNDGMTALLWAVTLGREAIIRLLLDTGADVGAKDNDGWTVLRYASGPTKRLLLDYDAKV